MSEPVGPPAVRPEAPALPPPWAFAKGCLVGAALGIPALGLAVWTLARAGFGERDLDLVQAIRVAALFAGVATVLTGGGVGRLAAHASVQGRGGRRRAMWVGGRTFAIAGAGLVLIAQIPHGSLPMEPWRWGIAGLAGTGAGAVIGVIIGAVCGGGRPLSLSDVLTLARWPSDAIRDLFETAPPRPPQAGGGDERQP